MREKLGDSVEIMKERIEDMNMGSGLRNTITAVVVVYLLIAVVLIEIDLLYLEIVAVFPCLINWANKNP